MRWCLWLAVAGMLMIPAETAWAADGSMGAVSRGTVTIRVTVAPRAWQASDGTLCVAAPSSGYSLRLADSVQPVTAVAGSTDCLGRSDPVLLPAHLERSGETLLIVAE